jgi:serine/threonine-protein kinase PRP4
MSRAKTTQENENDSFARLRNHPSREDERNSNQHIRNLASIEDTDVNNRSQHFARNTHENYINRFNIGNGMNAFTDDRDGHGKREEVCDDEDEDEDGEILDARDDDARDTEARLEREMMVMLGQYDCAEEEEKEMERRRRRRREIVEEQERKKKKRKIGACDGDCVEDGVVMRARDDAGDEKRLKVDANGEVGDNEENRVRKENMEREREREREGRREDMFGSESEDMFGESDVDDGDDTDKNTNNDKKGPTTIATTTIIENQALKDNWDDVDGYYRAKLGERLDDDRYEVTETNFGKGVFSSVLKARDLRPPTTTTKETDVASSSQDVAIKIIRNNETMRKASKTEIAILKKLSDLDPDRKKHVVSFYRSFEFRNHVFLVFEKLEMNLREAAKKFGRDVGISIQAVRAYSRQLFVALIHLQRCGVVHADIKPDNVLVNDTLNVLKICDFGSAMFNADNELTPYLASRFYRAPEVVLGLPYSFPIDLWAVGCCLYELYIGKICFPGKSNNEMLKYFVEVKGAVPKKLLRKAAFKEKHFDRDGNLRVSEIDKVTGKVLFRVFDQNNTQASKSLENILVQNCLEHSGGSDDSEKKKVKQLADLLEKIFTLDAEKRISCADCLQHPFIVD